MIKKMVLLSLVLSWTGISSGIGNDIIQVSKSICNTKYSSFELGLAHCIVIKNISDKTVTIDPSIIAVPLISYQKVARAYKDMQKKSVLILSGSALVPAILASRIKAGLDDPNTLYNPVVASKTGKEPTSSRLLGKRIIFGKDPLLFFKVNLATAGVAGSVAMYALYKYLTEKIQDVENQLKKNMLYEPVTLKPGEQIKKIFWLKNPKDQVSINFDAVQV